MLLSNGLKLDRAVNIDDLRKLAQRRVPRAVFDYIDGGADDEITLRDNRRSWQEILFQPHNAVATPKPDTRVNVLGSDLALPMILAPLGSSRMFHPSGELAAAKAAGQAGIGYTLSTFSGYTFAELAAASTAPLWYQVYLAGGREVSEATFARAWQSGFKALAVTIDTNGPGMRERDFRNGAPQLMGKSLFAMLPFTSQVIVRPKWAAGFLMDRSKATHYANVIIPGKGPLPSLDVQNSLRDSVVTWADLKWIRGAWPGHILVKGVITGDDARRAVDAGVSGLIVSNHGGRQLDTCFPTARALPEVLEAVNGQAEVLVDGGIRRGSDIVKAICMGAKAVLIGRGYGYGLAAAGQAGVARAIAILKTDIERTLILLGCPSIGQLDRSYIRMPKWW
ncbi:MAG TPA: alpha-hydroxy acid oxidase [Bryobacteraceae bacterium]|nr:alpha-hydroxy acid oxidase [Bryobacteraceae bacterium]